MTVLIKDLWEAAQRLLPRHIKTYEDFENLLKIYIDEMQELEQVHFDIWDRFDIASATGEMLDFLGNELSVERGVLNDEEYRQRIYEQKGQSTSSGQGDQVILAANLLLGRDDLSSRWYPPDFFELYFQSDDFYENTVVETMRTAFVAAGKNFEIVQGIEDRPPGDFVAPVKGVLKLNTPNPFDPDETEAVYTQPFRLNDVNSLNRGVLAKVF